MKRIQVENRTDLKSEIPLEAPYSLFIDPSSACNFKCKFCMNDHIKDKQVMDFALYRSIIDSLDEFKSPIKTVRLYGFGEPLVNPKFAEMVAYAKRSPKVLSVDTTTNASLLNPRLNEEIIGSRIDRINISVEGVNSQQYMDFTGRQINFVEFVQNIEHLYSIRGDTVIFIKINGDRMTELDKKFFYTIFGDICDGLDIEYTMSCWYGLDIPKNEVIGVYGQPRESVNVCPYIFYSLMIQPSGEVSVCFLDWDKRMVIGDVRERSIKAVWDSDELKNFRIDMLNGVKNSICANCDQLRAGMPVNLDEHAAEILGRL
ncbi:MAG: radical SAM/SPASM domain-containing protein [Phycisphaerae bacterium]|jgi:radical SAM protein with 4Fe4S-binding SPASM domain